MTLSLFFVFDSFHCDLNSSNQSNENPWWHCHWWQLHQPWHHQCRQQHHHHLSCRHHHHRPGHDRVGVASCVCDGWEANTCPASYYTGARSWRWWWSSWWWWWWYIVGLLDRGGNGNVENNDYYNCCEYNMEIIKYGELPLAPWQHVPLEANTCFHL